MATCGATRRVAGERIPPTESTPGDCGRRVLTRRRDARWSTNKSPTSSVTNIFRHLEKVHNIPKEEVTEDVLPKGTPPFPGREYMSCSGHVLLGVCELRIVPCESAKGVYKSRLFTQASLSIRLELNKLPV